MNSTEERRYQRCSDPREKPLVPATPEKPGAQQNCAPQKCNFPGVSTGYAGQLQENSTLNSRYFALFWNTPTLEEDLQNRLFTFPQRVPRIGFFDELLDNESSFMRSQFAARQNKLRASLSEFPEIKNIDPSKKCLFLNLLNASARMGLLEELARLNYFSQVDQSFRDEWDFLIALYVLTFKVSYEISLGDVTDLAALIQLCKAADRSQIISPLSKAKAYNRLIVVLTRYKGHDFPDALEIYATKLASILLSIEPKDNFSELMTLSALWRGLPMWNGFDLDFRNQALRKSLELVLRIEPQSETQRVLKNELHLTLVQTLSKWSMSQNQASEAENYHRQMIELDPFDSTATSEYALFLTKQGRHREAFENFRKAAEQGPPGLAMNLYFWGQCAQKLSEQSHAIEAFERSSQVDPFALSPRLELFRLYRAERQIERAQDYKASILMNADLAEQLTPEERDELTDL
jgi:tetratricopeptide (TPR) repeat protein